MSALKMLAAKNNWDLSSKKNNVSTILHMSDAHYRVHTLTLDTLSCTGQVSLYTVEESQSLCFRVEFEMEIPAQRAFILLSDLSRRHEWDQHYTWDTIHTTVLLATVQTHLITNWPRKARDKCHANSLKINKCNANFFKSK